MSEKLRVFVYGTLLSGEYNNRLLSSSQLLGEATVRGLEMHDLGSFPACVKSELTSEVKGEVWEIDENTQYRLDILEGYPNFYDRIQVEDADGKFGVAWVYICERARQEPLIESGSWREHLNGRD